MLDSLGLLRSFMSKGETLSMSGPKGIASTVFLPVDPSMSPLDVCGHSNLGFKKGWARE